jgi:hypothetical protein
MTNGANSIGSYKPAGKDKVEEVQVAKGLAGWADEPRKG